MTNRDPNQVIQFEHDEKSNAKRVIVVGQALSIDSDKLAEAVKDGLSQIKLPEAQKNTEEKTIFVPITEVKTIEVPVIIKEIEYREIEKPIITEVIKVIEVPVIIKETQIQTVSASVEGTSKIKLAQVIRDLCILGLMIYHLFSHIK
jgi:hypothetical protein